MGCTLNEALKFLGIVDYLDGSDGHQELVMPKHRKEQRELAEAVGRLPHHFAEHVSPAVLRQISLAAAAGRWEQATSDLIRALHARRRVITNQEYEKLRLVLQALEVPTEQLDPLLSPQVRGPSP
ncbi:hypothetical protein [Actinomadura sp. DC4]|uniref:hypothetical protein n=1 Tax=Actinomadura sp. DC4 TaxID=3055069 RepID=UPI0025AF3862|nr:hypothetical protein [Actinomadura sp. DC4]MDN3358111.1 hypothetical protein [Actinomadura sp. DC4]